MKWRFRFPALLMAVILLVSTAGSWAVSVPSWSATVPASTLNSVKSTVTEITPGFGNTTLVILAHSGIDVPGIPAVQTGTQVVLLSPAGKVLASADISGQSVVEPVYISAKRCVLVVDGVPVEFAVKPGSETFTQSVLTLPGPNETLVPLTLPQDNKFVYSVVVTDNKVTIIRRYVPAKLLP